MKSIPLNFSWIWMTAFAFALPTSAMAQIDLDHPVPVSPTDQIYLSKANPGVAYAFPKALVRLSDPLIFSEGTRLIALFDMGVDPTETQRLKTALARSTFSDRELRYIRPLSVKLIPASASNLPEGYHPEVTPVGDPAAFGDPVPYRLVVDRAKGFLSASKGMKLMSIIFGQKHMDHIGSLAYEFNSVVGGVPRISQSQLPIFTGETEFNTVPYPLGAQH